MINQFQKVFSFTVIIFLSLSGYSQNEILWGNAVPDNWNGEWPAKYQTASEKSGFTHTANNQDILEYFAMLRWNSENVHVFTMFTSDRGRTCPVLVLANPRITSASEAKESGKTIVYLQGGIHPNESEGKEALLMLTRDILFGEKKYLLDELLSRTVVWVSFSRKNKLQSSLHLGNLLQPFKIIK